MSVYTSLSKENIRQILQGYAVGHLVSYTPLNGGLANTNYSVTTDCGNYVLTICDSKSFDETEMLAQLLLHLANNQFATSKIIGNAAGNMVGRFQQKPVLLKTYIAGRVLEQFEDELLMKLGSSLGKLHQLSPPEYLPELFPYGEQVFNNLQKSGISHPFIDWLSAKHQYIKDNLHADLPKTLIHGDLFPSNVVVTREQAPIIMDFEEACYYYRIFDLGTAIIGLCSHDGRIILDKVHTLIKGYQYIIALTPKEKEHLKAFVVYAATTLAYWRFKQFNIIFPADDMKDSYKEMCAIADQVYEIPNKKILP